MDGISLWILQIISDSTIHIINTSLFTAYVAELYKATIVTSTQKKRINSPKRAIRMLSILSKVQKKEVGKWTTTQHQKRSRQVLENNIVPPLPFWKSKVTVSVLLNLFKTLDTICHDLLVNNMSSNGVSEHK